MNFLIAAAVAVVCLYLLWRHFADAKPISWGEVGKDEFTLGVIDSALCTLKGNPKAAIEQILGALKVNQDRQPKEALMFANIHLAEAYLLDGSYELVIQALSEFKDDVMREGARNGLDFAMLHRLLAFAYIRTGEVDKSDKHYDLSLEFHRKTKPYKESLLQEIIILNILDAEHSFANNDVESRGLDADNLKQKFKIYDNPYVLILSAFLLTRYYKTEEQSDKNLLQTAKYLKFLNSLNHDFEHVRIAKAEYPQLLAILEQHGLAETNIQEIKLNNEQREALYSSV